MPRATTPPKVVYVLGAGFSCAAGGPSQESLLGKVLAFECSGKDCERQQNLLSFLRDKLSYPADKLPSLSLEDIYTPIDRCLSDRVSLRGLTHSEIDQVRSDLDYLISKVIQYEFDNSTRSKEYVKDFAAFLVKQAAGRAQRAVGSVNADDAKRYDPFSVVSLNWDILLDNAIDRALQQEDAKLEPSDYAPFGVVDYCCYVSSLAKDNRRIRSGLWSLGARGYNVKLLKLHGSMNWLQCTNCQRLFTAFDEKLVVSERAGDKCRHCHKYGIEAELRSTLIMPTFLKDFSNFQLKLVWQNAAVEIMEAKRLVFIGYSLPHADFEFRQLLTRMARPGIPIDVVLFKEGNPARYREEVLRYEQFFAAHPLRFEPKGVAEYVQKQCRLEALGAH